MVLFYIDRGEKDMQTRMEKYTEAHEETGLRFKKNEQLYKKINDQELDKYVVKTNAKVLGDNTPSIDVEHIKKILDNTYSRNLPKRRSIVIPEENKEEKHEDIIETKEYDINLILEKAKENANNSYEKDRYKKLSDTQYNILKDLNIKAVKDDEVDVPDKDELRELINTITQKELENRQKEAEDDLFADLKGGDDTVVLEGMKEEITNELTKSTDMEDSFYTSQVSFTKSDFDDFDDLKKEVKGHKIAIIIITIIVIIAILFCIFLLLNNLLGLNIF